MSADRHGCDVLCDGVAGFDVDVVMCCEKGVLELMFASNDFDWRFFAWLVACGFLFCLYR